MFKYLLPLSKLPGLVLLVVLPVLAFSRPNMAKDKAEHRGYENGVRTDTLPSFVISWGYKCYIVLLQIIAIIEAYIVVSQEYPSLAHDGILSVLAPAGQMTRIRVTNTFFVGLILYIGGAALRRKCYQALGSNFTFEITIRKGHTLCTDGPYAVVRHPSYTAVFLCAVAEVLCHFGPGSWWAECGLRETLVGWAILVMVVAFATVAVMGVFKRAKVEDALLEKEFGDQWVQWAGKTRYATIPFVF
ncbi:hypothetical protein BXZ70DRAFT_920579 [Cristinia sonorae]|uniref:Protein-S-isoprenylcysteine O-methyltransferase n=1 Tax=Cristinia sonorae TaxID=1940300 RepID=A0A8K0XT88_9AGAR|nr:hypothetical protein BXZ70DRAFT_920579 [Cristinia sonorae]